MIVRQIEKWQEKLPEGFTVDTTYAVGYKKLRAIKREKLNDELFIELAINFTYEKDLIATIELVKIMSTSSESKFFLGQTMKVLFSECISKQMKANNKLIFNATKEGEWLEQFNTIKETYIEKIERGEIIHG